MPSSIVERMHGLLGTPMPVEYDEDVLDAIAECLEKGGLTIDAETPEAYIEATKGILEDYEMQEESRQELTELLGTLALAALGAGLGKWAHGKYKKWSSGRKDKKAAEKHAKEVQKYNRELVKHERFKMKQARKAMKADRKKAQQPQLPSETKPAASSGASSSSATGASPSPTA